MCGVLTVTVPIKEHHKASKVKEGQVSGMGLIKAVFLQEVTFEEGLGVGT